MSGLAVAAGAGALWVLEKAFDEGMGRALDVFLEGRRREGQARLARQIARGKPWRITDDKAAAAMLTYRRAVEEGVAQLNLEMLARVLVTGAQEPEFAPDEFRRQAEMIANLSVDEITVLAFCGRVEEAAQTSGRGLEGPLGVLMVGPGLQFTDAGELTAVLTALLRTGLLIHPSGWGGSFFSVTAAYRRLMQLVDIEDAIAQFGGDGA